MRRFIGRKWIAWSLVLGIIVTSIFPSSVFAEELAEEYFEDLSGDMEAQDVKQQEDMEDENEEHQEAMEDGNEIQQDIATYDVLLISDAVPDDNFGAISADFLAGAIKYRYENAEKAQFAFDNFIALGYVAEIDTAVDVISEERKNAEDVKEDNVDLDDVTVVEEELKEKVEVDNHKKVLVAIIDTGLDASNEAINGRLSVKTAEGMSDENGHGTLMAEIIASQTSENVEILPIKAFDENGKSTVGSVYEAINEAIYHKADVINLSVSGMGSSAMLTKAIALAKENNIAVVVSAGNDASDVNAYMPGNIQDAITVSATDENKEFALYSNYGEKIDFASMGTIIKDMGTEDTKDDEVYEGTSIASAYVSGYIAHIFDENENANIYECLIKSAEDLGDKGKDAKFGYGFLSADNLVTDSNRADEVEEEEKEDTENKEDEEVEDESEEAELSTMRNITASTTWNLSGGTILTDGYKIAKGVTLVINGNGNGYVNNIYKSNVTQNVMFYVAPGARLIMNGVWLNCNGSYGNGIYASRSGVSVNQGGYLEMNGCDVFGAVSGGHGVLVSQPGGDGAENYSPVTAVIRNTTFRSNHNGLITANPTAVEGCRFQSNTTGVYATSVRPVSISGSTFSANNEGINNQCTPLSVNGSTFSGNTHGTTAFTSTSFQGCTFENNGNGVMSYGGINAFYNCTGYGNGVVGYNAGGQIDAHSGNYYDNTDAAFRNDAGNMNLGAANIYSNTTGVKNGGSLDMRNTNIYSNSRGVDNTGRFNMFSGSVNNNSEIGIANTNTFTMTGGTIHSNLQGLWTWQNGVSDMQGGEIFSNRNEGIVNQDNGTVIVRAGAIRHNGYRGIFQNGAVLYLQGGSLYGNGYSGVTCYKGTSHVYYENGHYPYIYSNPRGINMEGVAVCYISSGQIFSNTFGLGNDNAHGNIQMSGGLVYNNTIGLRNGAGYSNIAGGAIYNSTQMNVDVYNGTVDFRGGSITGSGAGYPGVQIEKVNTATFNQYANIGTNSYGGVRNNAQGINRYNVYNGATSAVGSMGTDVGVRLDPGASMTIHQPLTADIKVASYDRYTGKVIANCDSEAIAQSAQQHLKLTSNASFQKTTLNTRKYADDNADLKKTYGYNYEALWNHYNNYGRNEGRKSDDANKTVVYRKANGVTGAKTQVIVSQVEDTTFDENLEANNLTNPRFSARIRTSDEFTGHKNAKWRKTVTTYWGEKNAPRAESIVYFDGEDVSNAIYNTGWASTRTGTKEHNRILNTYACWYPTTLYAKYDTGYDPNANHNDLEQPEKDDGTDDILDANPQAPDKIEGDTPQPQGFSYFMNGNNQDKGKNYTIRHVSSAYPMPNNEPFEKKKCSGQGWSVLPTATYLDEEEPTKCRKEGETADTLMLLNALLERDDCEVMYGNGNFTITQYVVWDHFPTITAKDVAIASYWLDTKTETEIKEYILKNVVGKDTEDGILTNNKEGLKGVIISDFDMDELRAFESTGNVSITFRATDGVGNETEKMVRLWVNSKKPVEGAYVNRARCINKRFYDAGKVSVGLDENDPHYLDGYKQGGLMPTDLWYTNEEYARMMEEAFANLENGNWEFVWTFTHDQVLETQDYIDKHGFGDSEEKGALLAYYNKYKGNITTDKVQKERNRDKHDYVDATYTKVAYCTKPIGGL